MLRLGAELLAVQPQVIGVAEHLLEEEPRLLQVAHTGEALDVPEGAHRERALLAGEPVGESTRGDSGRESLTSSCSIARSVEIQRGSVGDMKRTSGMRSVAASTVVAPTCWTNAPRPASQNRVNTSWKIRSRVSYHFTSGAGNERLVAKRIAPSN